MVVGARFPKVIWCLWLQGWDKAPQVARACLESWIRQNPQWHVRTIDQHQSSALLPQENIRSVFTASKPDEAKSDQIRIELLHRYGGVWVDATTLCMIPLDDWLENYNATGFFAFERPTPDRMVASWFLAAEKGNYIIRRWREATLEYWSKRDIRDDYFWFHRLFAENYEKDAEFRDHWDRTPRLPAMHKGHFGPNDPRLLQRTTTEQLTLITSPPSPVFKLSHKLPADRAPESFISTLCKFAEGLPRYPRASEKHQRRLLLTWYGSFGEHGTIGDLRSLEVVAAHLVSMGHDVSHASAHDLEIPGAHRVSWRDVASDSFDAVLFVCGPVLRSHPQTSELFRQFCSTPLIGVSVSLLSPTHPNFFNPFSVVLARQGSSTRYGDVAIAAPAEEYPPPRSEKTRIGVALRGPQFEYGENVCLWRETENLALQTAHSLTKHGDSIVTLENHLHRSGTTPEGIEREYSQCNLILTSRFHGAVLAMRHGVPFIAIDQIKGGAKVFELLTGCGWDHVYRIEDIDAEQMQAAAARLIKEHPREALSQARSRATQEANYTLFELDRLLARLGA